MTALSRPSHFMMIFLLSVGAALLFASEWVVPQPAKKPKPASSKAIGRVINPGVINPGVDDKSDGDSEGGTKEPVQADQTGEGSDVDSTNEAAIANKSLVTRRERGDTPALPALWTLAGAVFGERLAQASSTTGTGALAINFPVDLELIPLSGTAATDGARLRHSAGADGQYRWEGLFPGSYRLRALPEETVTEFVPIAVDVNLPEIPDEHEGVAKLAEKNPIFRQEITLPRARTLIGSIRIKEGGAFPEDEFAGLRISVSELGIARGQAVATTDGRFQIQGVGHGPYDFKIQDSKGRDVRWEIGQWAPTQAETAPSEPEPASEPETPVVATSKSPARRGPVRVAIVLP